MIWDLYLELTFTGKPQTENNLDTKPLHYQNNTQRHNRNQELFSKGQKTFPQVFPS